MADGPPARDMGIHFPTRMALAKLSDGSVWISSPVLVPFDTLTSIRQMGPIHHLVSPTPRHYWRLKAWHVLFPEAELWSSPITPVTLKEEDLPLTGVLDGRVPGAWAADFDQELIGGSRLLREVAFFHRPSRTLLLEDVFQVHAPKPDRPLLNAALRLGGIAGPDGGVARDIRLSFRDRTATRESVDRILAWDFDKVVVAHGPVIREGARAVVEKAFGWLRP